MKRPEWLSPPRVFPRVQLPEKFYRCFSFLAPRSPSLVSIHSTPWPSAIFTQNGCASFQARCPSRGPGSVPPLFFYPSKSSPGSSAVDCLSRCPLLGSENWVVSYSMCYKLLGLFPPLCDSVANAAHNIRVFSLRRPLSAFRAGFFFQSTGRARPTANRAFPFGYPSVYYVALTKTPSQFFRNQDWPTRRPPSP